MSSELTDFLSSFELQLEDWRQRPLPVEMVQYARTDAHYLLYIAHCLASELEQLSRGMPCICYSMSNLIVSYP